MHTYWRLGPAEELASSIRSPAQAIRGERAVRLEDALRAGKILSLGGEKVNAVKRGSHPPPLHTAAYLSWPQRSTAESTSRERVCYLCHYSGRPPGTRWCAADLHLLSLPLPSALAHARRHMNSALQLVELKNGETYNGHLVSCDNWMNIR